MTPRPSMGLFFRPLVLEAVGGGWSGGFWLSFLLALLMPPFPLPTLLRSQPLLRPAHFVFPSQGKRAGDSQALPTLTVPASAFRSSPKISPDFLPSRHLTSLSVPLLPLFALPLSVFLSFSLLLLVLASASSLSVSLPFRVFFCPGHALFGEASRV